MLKFFVILFVGIFLVQTKKSYEGYGVYGLELKNITNFFEIFPKETIDIWTKNENYMEILITPNQKTKLNQYKSIFKKITKITNNIQVDLSRETLEQKITTKKHKNILSNIKSEKEISNFILSDEWFTKYHDLVTIIN
jgi:hypothetical protein